MHQAVQREGVMLASDLNGEVFVVPFEDLVRSVVWLLKRFLHSIVSDVHMRGCREFVTDIDFPWQLLPYWCGLKFGHDELEPGDIFRWVCKHSGGFWIKQFSRQAKCRAIHQFSCVALNVGLQSGAYGK